MYKSTPLLMVQENKQVSAIKLIACYQYKSAVAHLSTGSTPASNNALTIDIYGIDKTGDRNLIAKCPLTTSLGYTAMAYASNTVTGIQVKQYNYIMYEYDVANSPDFANLIGQPILTVDVQEYSDMLDSTTQETAVIN